MRKLCPYLLVVGVLLAGCTSAHSKPTSRPSTPLTTQSASATESPTPSAVVASSSPVPTPPPSTSPTSGTQTDATVRVTVAPVTSAGDPAPGYSVESEDDPAFSCSGEPSQVAVSPNIQFCGYSATNTVACWKSSVASTALCLRDPLTRKLVRIKYSGTFAATPATAHPVPQALLLENGTSCRIRDGGAWSSVPSQPTWVGWYYCAAGGDIYGPPSGNGIDQTGPTWTVHSVASGTGQVTAQAVMTAYFVGTA